MELKSSAPFLLQSVDGLGDVDADIQTQKAPFQDGSTYIDSVLQERAISLEIVIIASDKSTLLQQRQYLASVFNPKLGQGILRYENGEVVREIEAVPDGVPVFPSGRENRGLFFQKTLVNLLCTDPYWKSPTIQEEPMAAFVELFEFPSDYWEVGGDGNLYFEMGNEGHTRTFINNGDAPVPIKIRIKGPTLNPTLTNLTTGEFIKVNRQLKEGDVLEINTEDGNKYVLLNGENVFNWIDVSSTFWKLQVGENIVQYTADAGQESATLEIEWQERFVGV